MNPPSYMGGGPVDSGVKEGILGLPVPPGVDRSEGHN